MKHVFPFIFDRTIFQNNWYPLHLGGMKNTPSQQNLHLCIALILGGGEIDPFSSSCLPEFRVCRGHKNAEFFFKKNISQSLTSPQKNLPSWCLKKGAKELDVSEKSLHRRERLGATPRFRSAYFSCMEAEKHPFFQRKIIWTKPASWGFDFR